MPTKTELVSRAEGRRRHATALLDKPTAAALGQHFTPAEAAALIASLPDLGRLGKSVRILDPGAGIGSLTAALVQRIANERPDVSMHVVAVELDPTLLETLTETLTDCQREAGITYEAIAGDFVELATGLLPDPRLEGFDLVILNPPYSKLPAAHPSRHAVAAQLVDVPNAYAAFWALAVTSLRPDGQCVAIVPRSWANGTYFLAFRKWLLGQIRLDALHVFDARGEVFKDTQVLQETVIVSGTRTPIRGTTIRLSTSVAHHDEPVQVVVDAAAVVSPDDPNQFVRFTDGGTLVPAGASKSLDRIGLSVSTGRVVDFRARAWLLDAPRDDAAPLVYPGNLRGGFVEHPRPIRKPQGLALGDEAARRLLLPPGVYVVVKRFSAKEERRRVVAAVWDRPEPPAFENHLNVFHERGHGLSLDVAHGLSLWLNSGPLDALFRTFSGHTQVNAGDLRSLPYPGLDDLARLGRRAPGPLPDQAAIDDIVKRVLAPKEMR